MENTEKKPWGELYGIRPINRIRQMFEEGLTESEILKRLDDLGVDEVRKKMMAVLPEEEGADRW